MVAQKAPEENSESKVAVNDDVLLGLGQQIKLEFNKMPARGKTDNLRASSVESSMRPGARIFQSSSLVFEGEIIAKRESSKEMGRANVQNRRKIYDL